MRVVIVVVVAALSLLIGSWTTVFAADPSLSVVTPMNGAEIDGSTLVVEFMANELAIVPSDVPVSEAGKHPEANRPGEGHVHLMLDNQPLVIWESYEPYRFTNVPPGEHQLMVELVNNDHSPLVPPVVQHIQVRTVLPQMLPSTGHPTVPMTEALVIGGIALGLILTGMHARRSRSVEVER